MIGRIAITSPSAVVDDDRALGDRLHRHDPDLGDVEDRHDEVRAEVAGVVDGERAAAEVVEPELVRPGAVGDVGDRDVEAVDRERVGVADDRHDQALVDRDRDPDVDPALGQQALLGPVGVEGRVPLEGLGGRLDDERDVAEADPLLRLVGAFLAFSRSATRRVTSTSIWTYAWGAGERPRHLRRDALAHLGHRDEDLVRAGRELRASPATGRGRRRARLRGAAGRGGGAAAARGRPCARGGARRAAVWRHGADDGLDEVEDVLAGDPPAAAGSDDLRRLEAVLAEQAADGRGHAGVGVAVWSRRDRRRPDRGRGGRGGGCRCRGGGRRGGGRGSLRALVGAGGAVRGLASRRRGSRARPRRCPPGAVPGLRRARRGCRRRRVPPASASSSVSMIAISALLGTTAPSSARISLSTPANGDGTSALTLSVMTSRRGSYLSTGRRAA